MLHCFAHARTRALTNTPRSKESVFMWIVFIEAFLSHNPYLFTLHQVKLLLVMQCLIYIRIHSCPLDSFSYWELPIERRTRSNQHVKVASVMCHLVVTVLNRWQRVFSNNTPPTKTGYLQNSSSRILNTTCSKVHILAIRYLKHTLDTTHMCF